jgi:hypothetical protein
MSGRFASPRFRRRLVWSSVAVAALAGTVVAAVLIGDTGRPEPERFSAGTPKVVHSPKLAHLTPRERVGLLNTSLLFVRTAVMREDLSRAYDLTGPQLRQGLSRKQWLRGNIPVVPFQAVGIAAWNVAYSYVNDVAFNLSLVAKPGTGSVVGKTFTIELSRANPHAHWLVTSWSPVGVSGPGNDVGIREAISSVPEPKAALSMWWLALPLALLAMIVVIPTGIGVRHWIAGRRSERAYLAERGYR